MKALMNQLRESAVKAILNADSPENLEALRVKYLGKKGELTPYSSRWASSRQRSAPLWVSLQTRSAQSLKAQ